MFDWDTVEQYIIDSKGIAWDTCHKIYVMMDDAEVAKMREYGYGDENDPDSLITSDQMSNDEMLATVKKWFDDSCALRFVQAVALVGFEEDPNEGFTTLIEQGAVENDEECEDCGEIGCYGACYVERCDNCGWDGVIYEDGMCRDCYDDSQEEDED